MDWFTRFFESGIDVMRFSQSVFLCAFSPSLCLMKFVNCLFLYRRGSSVALVVLLFLLLFGLVPTAFGDASCYIERSTPSSAQMMVRILTGECSEDERIALAVSAQEVLAAFEAGYGVWLEGVVLLGDLILDTLPLGPLPNLALIPSAIGERIHREQLTEVRSIQGPILFDQVDVRGILSTNLVNQGFMFFHEPVLITRSKFKRSVDFSRAIFLQEADFSDTTIRYEGFFIQAVFIAGVKFTQFKFGSHTRFHKAVFSRPSSFRKVEFPGLAEFLEVGFQQKTDFSHVHFMQGTGFSGSQFQESPDFSQSLFDRETFFRFAQFESCLLYTSDAADE